MPCHRQRMGTAGEQFRFRITEALNVFAGVGRLRITGPATGHSQDFTFAELEHGIGWVLDAQMSYTLRVLVQPDELDVDCKITAQTSVGSDTCSRSGAGLIGEWAIDVL